MPQAKLRNATCIENAGDVTPVSKKWYLSYCKEIQGINQYTPLNLAMLSLITNHFFILPRI